MPRRNVKFECRQRVLDSFVSDKEITGASEDQEYYGGDRVLYNDDDIGTIVSVMGDTVRIKDERTGSEADVSMDQIVEKMGARKTAREWRARYDISFVNQINKSDLNSIQEGAKKMITVCEEIMQKEDHPHEVNEAHNWFDDVAMVDDIDEASESFDKGMEELYDWADSESVWLGSF
ncbi:hypothetical protein KKH23_07735 [Patescibacteria group bacterium]|nr:hypothetical protein [Patescibacteria group bacterium]